ncbi:MAG TPA: DUF1579 domain-containing protein [Pirellulaceae bacterium]|nr:DUF1579 domain-containing protein [Pirellulaceae bacterium]HMO91816.1 DUF1579 domain-containing protein [Pirellulaceae bacterium]HMP69879.1 DUF1579 domain-containing protein [Pirellulaceae bacterium]
MFATPQAEHQWLAQLVGNWNFDHECTMPDGSKSVTAGKMTCRMLGGMWLLAESSGETPDSGPWGSLMTVGFDTTKNQFVGTFVGSMMSMIWPYHGELDATGKRLPLNSQGPKFDGSGIGNYRDTIEIIDENTWLFTSELQTDEGEWIKFLDGKHVRATD